ncbi:hypothetical protein EF888_17045 [Silicimonas algicola]|uniref:Uncharacterized protein n=1 Tax=Silicimonas algicola TaxID=1826607 RepID=A0A316G5W0_9RHOB|nr:hypothetical protein [Silicimonas algicola]AZQ68684.1 hypothetical protein EF888_17045 [Silicimonas algicola]PWK56248.1 hypothetical protein C8D95_105316 [Silicimonas algicola]
MMICKADFEDLFPLMFQPEDKVWVVEPSAKALARWEDDGGRAAPVEPSCRPATNCSRPLYLSHPAITALTMSFIAYGVIGGMFGVTAAHPIAR